MELTEYLQICLGLVIIGIICYYIAIIWRFYPLLRLFIYKLQFGEKVDIYFNPYLGLFKRFQQSLKDHNDILYYEKRVSPKVEVGIANGIKGTLIYSLYSCESLKFMMANPQYYKKNMMGNHGEQFLYQGMLFQEGAQWKKSRSLLAKHFEYSTIKASLPLVISLCDKYLSDETKSDINSQSSLLAGEVVTKTFFGQDCAPFSLELQYLIEQILSLGRDNIFGFLIRSMVFGKSPPRWTFFEKEKVLLDKLANIKTQISKMIQQKCQEPSNDFISAFVPDLLAKTITEEEVIQQYITLLFAGMDTTSHVFSSACYALSKYPQFQEKLRAAIQAQISKEDFPRLTTDIISKIPYLQHVIDEALRLYTPAAALLEREVIQDHYIGKYFLKKGTFITPSVITMNHNPEVYDKPFEFNPDRWQNIKLERQLMNLQSYQFIPFSAGQRNCIGQHLSLLEMKTMLIYMLLNYKIEPILDNVTWTFKFVYCIKEEVFVKLSKI